MSSDQDLQHIKTLIAKREKYFARLQALFDVGKSCLESAKSSKPYANELESFTSRYQRLEDDYIVFERISDDIVCANNKLKSEDKIETHSVSMSYDELYFNVKTLARKMKIDEKIAPSKQPPSEKESTPITTSQNRARLPELELDTFDGNISAWPNFYSMFMSGIHNIKGISKVEKFMYLRSYLKSHALSLIETLDITDDNYDIAMQILIDRYQNKRLLASNYLDKMLSFRQMSDDSTNSYNKFLEVFNSNISAFKALKIKDPFDFAILHIGLRVLSPNARKEFENKSIDTEFPAFEDLIKFVQNQIKTSELIHLKNKSKFNDFSTTPYKQTSRTLFKRNTSSLLATASTNNFDSGKNKSICPYCHDSSHKLYSCSKFKFLSVPERHEFVKRNTICFCCLSNVHLLSACKSTSKCKICSKLHHTLLHFNGEQTNLNSVKDKSVPMTNSRIVTANTSTCNFTNINSCVNALLGTAIIGIKNSENRLIPVRAIIDNGSQTSLITLECAKNLNLPRISNSIRLLTAANNEITQNEGTVLCSISPLEHQQTVFSTQALVVTKISVDQPNTVLDQKIRENFRHLTLADPFFDKPSSIDFLIGSDMYFDILEDSYSIIKGEPSAYATKFGWVIGGRLPNSFQDQERSYFLTCCESVDHTLKKFWEVEDISTPPPLNEEEVACENHFVETHTRDASGRYIVALPFKNTTSTLPNTRDYAFRRLINLETRLKRCPSIYIEYRKFMDEYISLGHMNLAARPAVYIIPHHCVRKETSSTTKLRVVFHASFSPRASNPSLNELLHPGPKLQRDISDIICKFRIGAVTLCADIKQMYRQVLVRQEDRHMQHIFYRTSPSGNIDEYELNVVTYGITSSAFQALRVLIQLVRDEGNAFPNASKTILEQTFVDDICESVDSIEEAINLQRELIQLLKLGGFTLRKWASNSQSVLEQIPHDLREHPLTITSDNDSTLKILGLQYNHLEDSFSYSIKTNPIVMTKRSMLSEISRIFDPLGWLTPVTFFAKHLMQQVWIKGLDWDELFPLGLQEIWGNFISSLPCITSIKIPRHTPIRYADSIQFIGFCDASEKGYAANVYLRAESALEIKTHLLKAKCRVAPLKTISIPRLELCAAQLLTRLIVSMKPLAQALKVSSVILFSDSSTVLSWIRTPPYKLKTFVANRVVNILEETQPSQWRHISSLENPCDCASRGLMPKALIQHQLWWHGPSFLSQPKEFWNFSVSYASNNQDSLAEIKRETLMITMQHPKSIIVELMENISSLIKLQYIIAYILRFNHNIKNSRTPLIKREGRITPHELQIALSFCVEVVQKIYFTKEIQRVRNNECPSKKYRSLTPFIDDCGFLRVGGRLKFAKLSFDAKHPLLIPRDSRLAILICDYYHKISLHAGPKLTQSLIQQKYWIVGIRQLLRQRIFRCQKCYIFQAKPYTPKMADLPPARFQDLRAFLNVGLDYAGPYEYKESHRRKAPRFKGYIVIFVCLSTKAVHLEFATSLSTPSFLAALDRFVGRRGLCQQILSDRGTNFVGAANYFADVYKFLTEATNDICDHLAIKGIKWKLNPPASPHMGGIWEAAVKSVRHHLDRVIRSLILTYEEMYTLLIRIEAILNSRPLCGLTSDPNDGPYLSPGHFLIGSPLMATPEIDVTDTPSNYLSRYELLQQAAQSFWKQWHRDYLHTLTKRDKWTASQINVKVGDVVYLQMKNSSPLEWPLGIIEEVFPGHDDIIRVAKIRTRQGSYVRPVHKLVAFPPLD